jgi:hypothetical protein
MPKRRPNGLILFEGASALDDTPIVAIATGFARKTRNEETGDMLQVWIMQQEDSPLDAHMTGNDIGVCGFCPIKESCYVQWERAPTAVWRGWTRGIYPRFSMTEHGAWIESENRKVRWGACGDPLALPYHLVSRISRRAAGITGYTHQWQRFGTHEGWQRLMMASVQSEREKAIANALGWRTFRIGKPGSDDLPDECHCPKAAESESQTTCEHCLLCAGTSRTARNVHIWGHGSVAKVSALLPVIDQCEGGDL